MVLNWTDLTGLVGQQTAKIPLCPPGITEGCHCVKLFMWVQGSTLRPSSLYSQDFIKWVISSDCLFKVLYKEFKYLKYNGSIYNPAKCFSAQCPCRSRHFLPKLHLTKYKVFNCRNKSPRVLWWCQILHGSSERLWVSLLLIYTGVIMEMT